ncbi:MAG TPA: sulfide/dihydroorotate dehydrogenase-like FAD/NAD-binding protein [Clostridia bacterium]|nr:sulfide/dihydroorotate dehydrogenase-like FAD/NAD-binding protein [Clostridia bacterium]
MNEIVKKRTLAPSTKLYVVNAPLVAAKAQPGQFVIVRISENGERIPLTIADYDADQGTLTMVFQEVGKTTKALGLLEEGDRLLDIVGPLGVPAELPTSGRVLCVGGGVGVAPIYPKAKAMHRNGVEVISIIAARTKELIILEEEMRAVSSELYIATDDGSRGFHGFANGLIKKLLDEGQHFDEIIAVGPMLMMKACVETTRPYGVKTWVSLNPIMVDGTGMCGACRVTVGKETKFSCVDGPMFDGHQVDFDEAIRRCRMYLDQERTALEAWCAHGGGCR